VKSVATATCNSASTASVNTSALPLPCAILRCGLTRPACRKAHHTLLDEDQNYRPKVWKSPSQAHGDDGFAHHFQTRCKERENITTQQDLHLNSWLWRDADVTTRETTPASTRACSSRFLVPASDAGVEVNQGHQLHYNLDTV
jgi:hypothetical protein